MNSASDTPHVALSSVFELAKVLQNARNEDLPDFQRCSLIISEFGAAQALVLFITRHDRISKSAKTDEIDESNSKSDFSQSSEKSFSSPNSSTPESGPHFRISTDLSTLISATPPPSSILLLVKNSSSSQIQALTLPPTPPLLRPLLSGLAPYFASLGADTARKKLADLDAALESSALVVRAPKLSEDAPIVIEDLINDADSVDLSPEVLNSIQNYVNSCAAKVEAVVSLSHDARHSPASEVSFWASKEIALALVRDQLALPGLVAALDALRKGKRFSAAAVLGDIGLGAALNAASDYAALLRDLPLEALMADNFRGLEIGISAVFGHLKRLRASTYPIQKAVHLAESITREVDSRIRVLLPNLLDLDQGQFEELFEELSELYAGLDREVKLFTTLCRELLRKREERFIFVRVDSQTEPLHQRMLSLARFRYTHHSMENAVRALGDSSLMEAAYDAMRAADVLDVSPAGSRAFDASFREYTQRAEKIARNHAKKLELCARESQDTREMMAVYSRFEFLFSHAAASSAVATFRTKLVALAKAEIASLEHHFRSQANLHHMFAKYDVSETGAAIIWARQIRSRLESVLSVLKAVMGPKWSDSGEGAQIFAEISVLRKKLNEEEVFQNWIQNSPEKDIEKNLRECVLRVEKSGDTYRVCVNSKEKHIDIFKQTRLLSSLGFHVPHHILAAARNARRAYPVFTTLSESVLLLGHVLKEYDALDEFGVLLFSDNKRVVRAVTDVFSVTWDNAISEDSVVREFESAVSTLHKRVQAAKKHRNIILDCLLQVCLCVYSAEEFGRVIGQLQEHVNTVLLGNFDSVELLVESVNKKLGDLLIIRAEKELEKRSLEYNAVFDLSTTSDQLTSGCYFAHSIGLHNQSIEINPPLCESKISLFNQLRDTVLCVTSLKTVSHRSFDLGSHKAQKFTFLHAQLNNSLAKAAYSLALELSLCEQYIYKWQRLSAIFGVLPDVIKSHCKENLNSWHTLIAEIRSARNLFDTENTAVRFGNVLFDYLKAQIRVTAQYDAWQKSVLHEFALVVKQKIDMLLRVLELHRAFFENTTSEKLTLAVRILERSSVVNENYEAWSTQCSALRNAQLTLVQMRYSLPSDWSHAEQLESVLRAVKQIQSARTQQIDEQRSTLLQRSSAFCAESDKQIASLHSEWARSRPAANLTAQAALALLAQFAQRALSAQNKAAEAKKAAEVFGVPLPMEGADSVLEEVRDLQKVWEEIAVLERGTAELANTSWKTVSARIVRRNLEELAQKARQAPPSMRQYAAFSHAQNKIKKLAGENALVGALHSDAVKGRHWSTLFRRLNKEPILEEALRLGDVWALDLLGNETVVKDVVSQAEGEKNVEQLLRKISETWSQTTLEWFDYNSKCRLVRGWDGLFKQINEDLELLSVMKSSAFFAPFSGECSVLEAKLEALQGVLDVWIDVQRQWVYLDGIFGGENRDITRLLPAEYARFGLVSADFFRFLKHALKSVFAIDLGTLSGAKSTLEKTLESLNRIRRSLGDYLERQRNLFPRFYFVGNEDLLAIIGGGKNAQFVGTFIGKIYSNIHSLKVEGNEVMGFYSKEGELVKLELPIDFTKEGISLIDWLEEFEASVRQTLLKGVIACEGELTRLLKVVDLDRETELFSLLDKYAGQVVILALRLFWTRMIEQAIKTGDFAPLKQKYESFLKLLSVSVATELPLLRRLRIEALVVESVYQNDVIDELLGVKELNNFAWRLKLRYYLLNSKDSLLVRSTDTEHLYSFEYQGLQPGLVKNDVIKKAFIHYNECLTIKKGGCSFGPAGTGKTESVKEFARALGRPVLVFNCDEAFDYSAVSRILVGASSVGAVVCFDEFNRLSEEMLSAVALQIDAISDSACNIFITMNPNYAGRLALPENLKKLFRSISIPKTDKFKIAEVLLYAQGFTEAGQHADRVVSLFSKLEDTLSHQKHYDFGLRAVKLAVVYCGRILREYKSESWLEHDLLVHGLSSSISPKLVQHDIESFSTILKDVFGSFSVIDPPEMLVLAIRKACESSKVLCTPLFMEKVLQLYNLSITHHGLIMVGSSGLGKSTARKVLLKALQAVDGIESVVYKINPQTSKSHLYGVLDTATREYKDGVFTSILRKILANLRGEIGQRTWIVFDGFVGPKWVESLNSVLDDNKCLTLSSGERIALPEGVKIVFETGDLDHATPATVSRCGMVWFGNSLFSEFDYFSLLELPASIFSMVTEEQALKIISKARTLSHAFDFVLLEKLRSFQCLIQSFGVIGVKELLFLFFWAFAGDCNVPSKASFSDSLYSIFGESGPNIELIAPNPESWASLDIEWTTWLDLTKPSFDSVEQVGLQLVPTPDITRLSAIISQFLGKRFLILCGPPGSGKTMAVLDYLRKRNYDVVSVNLGRDSGVRDILSAVHERCFYEKSGNGLILKPKSDKKVTVFLDEINLPKPDEFGAEHIVQFLREIAETGGFYKDNMFVRLERISFIGACNLPSDPGRNKLSARFVSHSFVYFVDYPLRESLGVIYNSMASPAFESKNVSDLSTIISCSLDIYYKIKEHGSMVSPRDVTRLIRALCDGAVRDSSLHQLLELFVHECQRVFGDRSPSEGSFCESVVKECVQTHFSGMDDDVFNTRIFLTWLSPHYAPVNLVEFRSFVKERLAVFSNEVVDSPLVLHASALHHVARIDRVLSSYGHLMLVGKATSGKSTLTRFVAWANGMEVIKAIDFDVSLKNAMKKAGCGEKVCFLVDDDSGIDSSLVERMNTLLANAEAPELFIGGEREELLKKVAEKAQLEGRLLDTEEEVYEWFTRQVAKYLHVVFCVDEESSIYQLPALVNRCVVDYVGTWNESEEKDIGMALCSSVPGSVDLVESMVRLCAEYGSLPADFLRFVQSFLKIYNQKLEHLEALQRRVNVGLDKLRDTVLEVKGLKESLAMKAASLKRKDREASEMLSQMLSDQNEAERKQEALQQVREALRESEIEIASRKDQVSAQLDEMYPIVEAAAENVKLIKKNNLSELRSMNNPPLLVKMTLEAVCCLLGYGASLLWRDIQGIMRKDDFILSILNFDGQVPASLRSHLTRKYFSDPSFTILSVTRALKACGPLLAWIEAQVKYLAVLEQVQPLQDEVAQLEALAMENRAKLMAIEEMLLDLTTQIERCKTQYTDVIRETERIKTEMQNVETKVHRSVQLMETLAEERTRWAKTDIRAEREVLGGEALIAAFFVVLGGRLDQKSRQRAYRRIGEVLKEHGVLFRKSLGFKQLLCTTEDEMRWKEAGLGSGSFEAENMAILEACDLYPYIEDPSGDIISVLTMLNEKKLVVTSFLDQNWLRHVEHALRFGTPLLIEDAEHYDAKIGVVLRKEFVHLGGRTLLTLDGKDVDCVDGFNLYLYSKSVGSLPEHVSGRTTHVNFAATRSSLENTILGRVLLALEPEVEARREELAAEGDLLKERLRQLEDSLLEELSESRGGILENAELVSSLEKVKKEALLVESRVEEMGGILEAIGKVERAYKGVGEHGGGIYEVLTEMERNDTYNWGVEYFVRIVQEVLDKGYREVPEIVKAMYVEVYSRLSPSLLKEDVPVFGVLLYFSYLEVEYGKEILDRIKEVLSAIGTDSCRSLFKQLLEEILGITEELNGVLQSHFCALIENQDSSMAKALLPVLESIFTLLHNTVNIDTCLASIFLNFFKFNPPDDDEVLRRALTTESGPSTPVFLFSESGFDPSFKVITAAQSLSLEVVVVAMGASEANNILTKEIKKAAQSGSWILAQNIHMAPEILKSLLKFTNGLNAKDSFRLVATSCVGGVKGPLLRESRSIIFAGPEGIKSSMEQCWKAVDKVCKPREKMYVLFVLSWVHSLFVDKWRKYDFNNTDFEYAFEVVQRVFRPYAGRENVNIETICWDELRYLLGEICYGGRVNEADYNSVYGEFKNTLGEVSFSEGFLLAGRAVPEGGCWDDYLFWINGIEEKKREAKDVLKRLRLI